MSNHYTEAKRWLAHTEFSYMLLHDSDGLALPMPSTELDTGQAIAMAQVYAILALVDAIDSGALSRTIEAEL